MLNLSISVSLIDCKLCTHFSSLQKSRSRLTCSTEILIAPEFLFPWNHFHRSHELPSKMPLGNLDKQHNPGITLWLCACLQNGCGVVLPRQYFVPAFKPVGSQLHWFWRTGIQKPHCALGTPLWLGLFRYMHRATTLDLNLGFTANGIFRAPEVY